MLFINLKMGETNLFGNTTKKVGKVSFWYLLVLLNRTLDEISVIK